ncbi:hypothetical protein LEMLEM_LOCUS27865 [Lemmus lemmus]
MGEDQPWTWIRWWGTYSVSLISDGARKRRKTTSSIRLVALNARRVQALRACKPSSFQVVNVGVPSVQLSEVLKRGSEAAPRFIDVRLGLKATEHPGSRNSHALDPRPPAFPFSQFLGFVDLAMPPPTPEEEPPYALVRTGAFSHLQIETFLPSKPA